VQTGTVVRDDDVAHLLVTQPVHSQGRMTGGGSIFTESGMRVTHGFELHCDIDVGPNNLQVNFDGNSFHLESLTAVNCYDDPALNPLPRPAPFDTLVGEGVGRFNGQAGYTVRFTFTDNGEPGSRDFAQIEIRDLQGSLVLFAAGNVSRGNQQAHPENKAAATMASAPAPVQASPVQTLDGATPDAWLGLTGQQWTLAGLTSTSRFDAATQSAPSPTAPVSIDWASTLELEAASTLPKAPAGVSWQDRFVNHLGASAESADPNASLRVHLDLSPELTQAEAELTA
jgi:hypothetical protein